MTIGKLILSDIVNDDTRIIIRCDDFRVITSGNWDEDNILNCSHIEVESFTWEKENVIYIDIVVE